MGERVRLSYSPHYTTTTRRNGNEERRPPEGTQRLRRAGQDHRHQEGRENLASSVHQASWAYLKEKDLQDPQNKQWFTPNDTMAPIFGTEKIKCFSMSKYLKGHLINPDK